MYLNNSWAQYPYVKVQTILAIQKRQLWPKDHFIPWTQTVEQLTSSCKIKCKLLGMEYKKLFFSQLQKKENDIFTYY